ncbi:exported protein precursor [Photobacterium gaetbulicola]|uniref:Exported protein n=1 Tax=Photobacterium gaetbulicola TaxID=1295392 RepID=A0A0B9G179_9GAMM|nr:UPF0149 family protein [Photobacterium gaetbulicola]KHT62444.1 exported protein precursor [Photobacterium gaetbulicola]
MSDVKLPSYETLEPMLKEQGLAVTPSELHGLLCGMICGGMAVDAEQWLAPVCDYANQGEALTDGAKTVVRSVFAAAASELGGLTQTLFSSTAAELAEMEFTVELLLPAEGSELMLRAEALSEWVTNFISGLGLMGMDKKQLSDDVTEAVAALEEIAQLGVDEDEDMQEQAMLFDNVVAYVPECVLTCLVGLSQRGDVEDEAADKPTLH